MKYIGLTFLTFSVITFLSLLGSAPPVSAEMLPMSNEELAEIDAKGAIGVGSFNLQDNHQFDSSLNKGAIIMDDNVMQFATGTVIVNATQSAIATGVISVGNITADTGTFDGSISIINTNDSTAFIGGF